MKPIILMLSLLLVVAGTDNKQQEFKLPEGRGVNVHQALQEYKVASAGLASTAGLV